MWKYKQSLTVSSDKDSIGKYIKRLLKEGDVVLTIYGPKGCGKSWTAISLCEQIDKYFCKEKICYTLDSFFKQMTTVKKGTKYGAIVLDDFGSELDPSEFNQITSKLASHFFQKSRTFHNAYFITTPNKAFINKTMRERLSEYYIEVIDKNKKGKYTLIKLNFIQINNKSGTPYYHRLVLRDGMLRLGGQGKKITLFKVPQPSKKLRSWYVPYRRKIGEIQLKKSAEGMLTSKQGKLQSIAAQIKANKLEGKYQKMYRGKNIWTRALLEMDYQLSQNDARKVCVLLEQNNSPPI